MRDEMNSNNFEYDDDNDFSFDKSYNESDYSYSPVRSASQYLYDMFHNDVYDESDDHKTEEILHNILTDLNRTLNLTSNSTDGQNETVLITKFSNGNNGNDLMNDVFYVNPNILLDDNLCIIEKNDNYFDALDGLNGQTLLFSFMRKNTCVDSIAEYKKSDQWSVKNIFMTDMQSSASAEISVSWPGFMSYVTQQMLVFGQNKKKIIDNIEKGINNKSFLLDDIIEFLCYNRLSNDKIGIDVFPEEFQEKIQRASLVFNNLMDKSDAAPNKFLKANAIYKQLLDIFDPDEKNTDPSVMSVDKTNSDSKRAYTGGDAFREDVPVDGNIISGTLDHAKKLLERAKTFNDSLKSKELSADEILTEKKYKLIVPPVNPDTISEYKRICSKYKKSIKDIKSAFAFKNNHYNNYTRGTDHGEIDENSLYRIHTHEFEKLYQIKDIVSHKKYHVTIALDQSGSMRQNIKEASCLSIVISEALKSIRDISFSVYGFNTSCINTIVYQDANYKKLQALSQSSTAGSTGLGYHIAAIADKVHQQYRNIDKKILFVITDGLPTHGSIALGKIEHTAYSVHKVRQMGIMVYGIGVAKAFNNENGKKMFGANNFTVINDVAGTLNVLTQKLKRYLQKVA